MEVKGEIHRLRRERATKTEEIPEEFWKNVGEVSIEWLTGLFNVNF